MHKVQRISKRPNERQMRALDPDSFAECYRQKYQIKQKDAANDNALGKLGVVVCFCDSYG